MGESILTDPHSSLPLGLRWFVGNGITHLQPWWFLDISDPFEGDSQFAKESSDSRRVLAFARRYDRDDFAGFELVDGRPAERVIFYHPGFGPSKNSFLVRGEYPSIFEFFSQVVVPDSKDWATEEDLADLPNYHGD